MKSIKYALLSFLVICPSIKAATFGFDIASIQKLQEVAQQAALQAQANIAAKVAELKKLAPTELEAKKATVESKIVGLKSSKQSAEEKRNALTEQLNSLKSNLPVGIAGLVGQQGINNIVRITQLGMELAAKATEIAGMDAEINALSAELSLIDMALAK